MTHIRHAIMNRTYCGTCLGTEIAHYTNGWNSHALPEFSIFSVAVADKLLLYITKTTRSYKQSVLGLHEV